MTKEEIQASSKKKVEAIETLCKQLEVVVSAEKMITPQGFIKQIVYYTDTEKYDLDKPEEKKGDITPGQTDLKEQIKTKESKN